MDDINQLFVNGTLTSALLKDAFPEVNLNIKKVKMGRSMPAFLNWENIPRQSKTFIASIAVIGEVYEMDGVFGKHLADPG